MSYNFKNYNVGKIFIKMINDKYKKIKNLNRNNKYYIYGIHSVQEALKNPKRKKIFLYVTRNSYQKVSYEIVESKVKFKILNTKELSSLISKEITHQGIILETTPLNYDYNFEELCFPKSKNARLVLLDQLYDPQNVGAILRTSEIFGIQAVITTKYQSTKETGTLAKSASGALEYLPYIRITNLVNTINSLKKMGYFVIGLDINSKSCLEETLKKIGNEPIAIVLGSEGKGLRELTKKNCDFLSKIPFKNNIFSLNVSSAAAIALYLTRRKVDKKT